MQKLYIPNIAKALNATQIIEFQEEIPELETLTPAQGTLKVVHGGNFLTVSAKAWTIVTLTCDRTLRQFNHRLVVNTEEMIWLSDQAHQGEDDLIETLSPQGYFDPVSWLYDQFCLAVPFPKIAPDAPPCVNIELETEPEPSKLDSRWQGLADLRSKLVLESQS